MRRRLVLIGLALGATSLAGLAIVTRSALPALPAALPPPASGAAAAVFTAGDGTPLNTNAGDRFNRTTQLKLWQMPRLTRLAFIVSEDKRYRQHGGVDWWARFSAIWTNLRAGHVVRGASTIGEQVSRILHTRPRTYWSHWIAGFDADRLLDRFGHEAVLRFYLNQVPYGAQQRGVNAGAYYYFGRSPAALDPAEQLALAVLIRSPSRYSPFHHVKALRRAVDQLGQRMRSAAVIDHATLSAIRRAPLSAAHARLALEAGPFVVYARKRAHKIGGPQSTVKTTLDPPLERLVQGALRARLARLKPRGVQNAAALVVDNRTGAIRAWAVAPKGKAFDLDPVLLARQPGSTLKPFVYGLAMTRLGWQPDTVIHDTPLAERVGAGVHRYRNYSGKHYGPVSLRYALANSLNVPAIKTAQAVGPAPILDLLRKLGFTTFKHTANYYGPAVALGDGAVRLFDLVQGYATLANHGRFRPLRVLDAAQKTPARRVLPATVTSILSSILSDPDARAAEFGAHSVLDLPYPTAVKTGTSSDYRDSWTVGYDNRYTVGIWMGRLAGGSTQQITGSNGPAPVLRQIFAHLRTIAPYAGLWHSQKLKRVTDCEWIGPPPCIRRPDWRLPGASKSKKHAAKITFSRPVPGETLAIDPRVARSAQRYTFRLNVPNARIQRVRWILDGQKLATTETPEERWRLHPGQHRIAAKVWLAGRAAPITVLPVLFTVVSAGAPRILAEGSTP